MHLVELHLNCAPRQRAATPAVGPAGSDQRDIVGMLIEQAQAQLAATLNDADSHDTKALGLLTVNVAGVALLLSLHAGLNRFWPALLAGAFLAAVGFSATLWGRGFQVGPAIDPLYEELIGGSTLAASLTLLDALNNSIVHNRRMLQFKMRAWLAGAAIMATTVIAAVTYLPVVR